MKKKVDFVIFGAPGAGKGTHSEILAKKYGFCHISTGCLLRKEVESGSELGQKIKKIMDSGALVEDELVLEMIGREVDKDYNGMIFDGFPRTVTQAKKLDELLKHHGRHLDVATALDVQQDELVKRMLERATIEQRSDDNEHTFKRRQEEYVEHTLPVLKYYEDRGLLVHVDAGGDKETTQRNINRAVNEAWPSD